MCNKSNVVALGWAAADKNQIPIRHLSDQERFPISRFLCKYNTRRSLLHNDSLSPRLANEKLDRNCLKLTHLWSTLLARR